MRGIIKKFDPQGFGIIESTDSSKVHFIRSDFARHQFPRAGLKVFLSIRRVKDKVFASPGLASGARCKTDPESTRCHQGSKIGSAQEFVKVLNWRGFLRPEAAGFGGWVCNHGPWVWRLDWR
jgi:hypothetical protein